MPLGKPADKMQRRTPQTEGTTLVGLSEGLRRHPGAAPEIVCTVHQFRAALQTMIAETPASGDGVQLERAAGLLLFLDTPKGIQSRPYFCYYSSRLRLTDSDPGRGVFAAEDIPAQTIIETCPALVLPPKDLDAIRSTELNHYT